MIHNHPIARGHIHSAELEQDTTHLALSIEEDEVIRLLSEIQFKVH